MHAFRDFLRNVGYIAQLNQLSDNANDKCVNFWLILIDFDYDGDGDGGGGGGGGDDDDDDDESFLLVKQQFLLR